MNYAAITVLDHGPIRTITLNRPERRNAMTPEMQEEIISAAEESVRSGSGVVLLTGAGDSFCSGLDLSVLLEMKDSSGSDHRRDAERVGRLFRTIYELPVPTIAVVNGPAMAGGAGLALVCDFTVASQAARFGFTEIRIGFVPALVSAFLTLQIGTRRARELLMSGRTLTAEEALGCGLISEVASPSDLQSRARQLAHALIRNSPTAIAATKRLLNAQNRSWLDAAFELSISANADARMSDDFKEGISAFLEKRTPVWSTGSAAKG